MSWEPFWVLDDNGRSVTKYYKLVAGHDPDGTPVIFTCDERAMKTIKEGLRRQRKRAKSRRMSGWGSAREWERWEAGPAKRPGSQ